MPLINMVQAINEALRQEMERDRTLIIMGEDVGINGGVFRVTEGLYNKFGPERVMDTPLAETTIVGAAIGMAAYGLKPVAEIQFDGFLPSTFDNLLSHASRLRTRSRGRYTVPLVVRAPYGGGIKALEHHSDSPEAFFTHIQGLKVVIPSTPYDAKGLLISAIRDPDPVLFLEPKKIYRAFKQEVPENPYTVPLSKCNIVKEGSDITIISWGAMLHSCLAAIEGSKISAEIIDVRTLAPLDYDTIIGSVKKTGRAVVVHEAPKTCGFGAELVALINEKAFLNMEAPVERVAGFDVVVPYPKLEDYYYPNVQRIQKAVNKVLSF